MIAVKVGTTSWRTTDQLAADEVEFTGEFLYADDGYTPLMVWDGDNIRQMTAQEQTARARETLKATVNVKRAEKLKAGFTFAGNRFDSDERSLLNLTATVSAVNAGIPLPDGFTWRTSDNVDVPCDAQFLVGLAGTALQYQSACHARSWALKAQIDAGEQVDIDSGW